jgi:hypothetical protein
MTSIERHAILRVAGRNASAARRDGLRQAGSRTTGSRMAAALGLLLVAACAQQAQLDHDIESVARALLDVESAGALRCAPRQLAVAQSQLEFARLERDQGFPARAREHLAAADENVRAALVLSPAANCASTAYSAEPDASPPAATGARLGAPSPLPSNVAPLESCGSTPCSTADAGR